MDIIIVHVIVLLGSLLDLIALSSLLGLLLSLLVDHLKSLHGVVASVLVGSDHLLEVIPSMGIAFDNLHHSRVNFDILKLLNDSQFDRDSFTE